MVERRETPGWRDGRVVEKTVSEPLRVMKGEKELDNKRGAAEM